MSNANGSRKRSTFSERFAAFLIDLRKKIRQPGYVLPSEYVLADEYHLSRSSVRKGLQKLVSEGLLETVHGKGTFVKQSYGPNPTGRCVRVAVWIPNVELGKWQQVFAKFEEENPDISVEVIRISNYNYADTLRDLDEMGLGPDVVLVNDFCFSKLQPFLELTDLSNLIDLEKDQTYPKVASAFSVSGRLLAAPIDFAPVVLAYNQDLFDQAGLPYPDITWTWHTLAEVASELTTHSDTGQIGQFGFGFSLHRHRWPIFLMQNQAKVGPSHSRLDDPHVLEAVSYLADLLHNRKVIPLSTGVEVSYETLFAQGRIAMIPTSYPVLPSFQNAPFRWDISVPPKGAVRATFIISVGLGVSGRTPRQAEALSLVNFFLKPETQRMIKQLGCSVPVLRQVADDGSDLLPELHPSGYHVFQQLMAYGHSPNEAGSTVYIDTLTRYMELLWNNLLSPEEACKKAQAAVEKETE